MQKPNILINITKWTSLCFQIRQHYGVFCLFLFFSIILSPIVEGVAGPIRMLRFGVVDFCETKNMLPQSQEKYELIPGDRGRKKIAQHGCEETMFKPQRRYLVPNQSADDTTKASGKRAIHKESCHLEFRRSEARHNIPAAVRSGQYFNNAYYSPLHNLISISVLTISTFFSIFLVLFSFFLFKLQ